MTEPFIEILEGGPDSEIFIEVVGGPPASSMGGVGATSQIIELIREGEQGPPGEQGDSGPQGGGGFVHSQGVASTVWDIFHSLGYDPAGIRVIAVGGDEWYPTNVIYLTPGEVTRLTFADSIVGTAWVS